MTQHLGKIKAVVLHRAGKTATFTVTSDRDARDFIADMIVDGFHAAVGEGEAHLYAPEATTTEDWLAGPKSRAACSNPAIPASNVVPIGTRAARSGPKTTKAWNSSHALRNSALVRGHAGIDMDKVLADLVDGGAA